MVMMSLGSLVVGRTFETVMTKEKRRSSISKSILSS